MLFVFYEHSPKPAFTLIYNTVITQGVNFCLRVIPLDLLYSEQEEIATFHFTTNKIT